VIIVRKKVKFGAAFRIYFVYLQSDIYRKLLR